MKIQILLLLIYFLIIDYARADIKQMIYGGNGNEVTASIASAPDQGFVVAGFTQSSGAGKRDIWILRLNANGSVLWQKSYGTVGDEIATSIARIPSGGFVVSGYEQIETRSEVRPFLIRIDDSGRVIWYKTFRFDDFVNIRSIGVTSPNEIVVAGEHEHVHSGAWVAKLNLAGEIVWQEKIGGNQAFLVSLQSLAITTDNEIAIIGQRLASSTADVVGYSDIWAAKLSKSGKIRWQKRYGVSQQDNFGDRILQMTTGGFIVAGDESVASTEDIVVLRISDDGVIQWQKRLSSHGNEEFRGIAEDSQHNIILVGRINPGFHDRGLMVTMDGAGNLLNQRQFQNANFLNGGVLINTNGSLTAAGHTRSFSPTKLADFWILNLTSPTEGPSCQEVSSRLTSTDPELNTNSTFYVPHKTNLKLSAASLVEQETHFSNRLICSR